MTQAQASEKRIARLSEQISNELGYSASDLVLEFLKYAQEDYETDLFQKNSSCPLSEEEKANLVNSFIVHKSPRHLLLKTSAETALESLKSEKNPDFATRVCVASIKLALENLQHSKDSQVIEWEEGEDEEDA